MCVIVGMDLLSRFGAMIDCGVQRVVVRTQVGENLLFIERAPGSVQVFFGSQGSSVYSARLCRVFGLCGWHSS